MCVGQELHCLFSQWEITAGKSLRCNVFGGGQGRGRTADLPIFRVKSFEVVYGV